MSNGGVPQALFVRTAIDILARTSTQRRFSSRLTVPPINARSFTSQRDAATLPVARKHLVNSLGMNGRLDSQSIKRRSNLVCVPGHTRIRLLPEISPRMVLSPRALGRFRASMLFEELLQEFVLVP